jgi:hypothetical protein
MVVRAIVHKEDERYLIEVSSEDGDLAGLRDGQELELDLPQPQQASGLDPEIRAIATRIIREHREALDYLAQ